MGLAWDIFNLSTAGAANAAYDAWYGDEKPAPAVEPTGAPLAPPPAAALGFQPPVQPPPPSSGLPPWAVPAGIGVGVVIAGLVLTARR